MFAFAPDPSVDDPHEGCTGILAFWLTFFLFRWEIPMVSAHDGTEGQYGPRLGPVQYPDPQYLGDPHDPLD